MPPGTARLVQQLSEPPLPQLVMPAPPGAQLAGTPPPASPPLLSPASIPVPEPEPLLPLLELLLEPLLPEEPVPPELPPDEPQPPNASAATPSDIAAARPLLMPSMLGPPPSILPPSSALLAFAPAGPLQAP